MQFDISYLTEAGRELATSTQGGANKIVYTHAEASSHDYSALSVADLKSLTSIEDVQQTVDYSHVTIKDKTSVALRVDFPSMSVTKSYNLYTVAFYARPDNGDEVLYAVMPSSIPDYVPAYDGYSNINDSFNMITTVSDTDNVMITVSQAGSLNEDDLDAIFASKHIATIDEVNAKQDKIGYTPADDSKVVHNTGSEEIAGTKTFDTAPIDKTTGNPYITKDGVPTVEKIADNTDLFSLVANDAKPHYYLCSSNDTAKTLKNSPVANAFSLELYPANTPQAVASNGFAEWVYTQMVLRPYNSSTAWLASTNTDGAGNISNTAWVQVATENDVTTAITNAVKPLLETADNAGDAAKAASAKADANLEAAKKYAVKDNGDGTVTVDGVKMVPANDSYVVKHNDAGKLQGKLDSDYGDLTVDGAPLMGGTISASQADAVAQSKADLAAGKLVMRWF